MKFPGFCWEKSGSQEISFWKADLYSIGERSFLKLVTRSAKIQVSLLIFTFHSSFPLLIFKKSDDNLNILNLLIFVSFRTKFGQVTSPIIFLNQQKKKNLKMKQYLSSPNHRYLIEVDTASAT